MWMRFKLADVRVIAYYVGLLVIGIAAAMLVPLLTSILAREWAIVCNYTLGIGVTVSAGVALTLLRPRSVELNHSQGFVVTAVAWLAASIFAAIPLSFSGSYPTYLDALFDAMSGLTTSGLTVATDLDHMALGDSMWRHLTHLIGGQGIVVAALSFAMGLRGGGVSLYLAEGRDERILPNVMFTVRFMWFVAAVFVGAGTLALTLVNMSLEMPVVRAALHGFWISSAAYDTGGFAPQSMNLMYYHSWTVEIVAMIFMLAGTVNFNLHAAVWRGDRQELWRNLEIRMLAANMLIVAVFAGLGAVATELITGPAEVARKVIFHVISANSGTGHQTVYAAHWTKVLGGTAFAAIMLAMAFGGAASSTAGGIKALRIGIIVKTVVLQVKRSLAPRSAVIRSKYHHLREQVLTSEAAGAAATLFIVYTVTYVSGGLIGAAFGYPAGDAVFESISATANVGLSSGITAANMPNLLKIVYMLQMWAGRLEFVAVFALVAHIVLALLPRRRRAAA